MVKHGECNSFFSFFFLDNVLQSLSLLLWQISLNVCLEFLFFPCHMLTQLVPLGYSKFIMLLTFMPAGFFYFLKVFLTSFFFFFFAFHPLAAEVSSGGGEKDPVLERQAYLDGEDGAGTGESAAHFRHSHLHSSHHLPVLQTPAQGSLSPGHAVQRWDSS